MPLILPNKMPGDETIFEGPVTPAPLFAYRALRSIFFASPESSPEPENKENIPPVTYTTSPMKSISAVTEPVAQLTPSHKRKWNGAGSMGGGSILSPTKGILRTPGLATPRAKYLKDISVKFKSVSPEAVDKRAIETAKADQAIVPKPKARDTKQAATVRSCKSVSDLSFPQTQQCAQEQPSSKSLATVSTCAIDILSPTAIEAYMVQTEKEMKKLVRYGQKMREFARKKDTENQELRAMVEQLKKENERLRTTVPVNPESRMERDRQERRIHEVTSPAVLRARNRGYVREEVDRVEATVRSQVKIPNLQVTNASASQHPERRKEQYEIVIAADPDSKPSSNNPDRDVFNTSPTSVSPRTSSTKPAEHLASSLDSRSKHITGHNNNAVLPVSSATTSTAAAAGMGTTRLPPDRLAAARDRLRRRAEARKTSAEIDAPMQGLGESLGQDQDVLGHPVKAKEVSLDSDRPQGKGKGDGEAEHRQEESQFDWANL